MDAKPARGPEPVPMPTSLKVEATTASLIPEAPAAASELKRFNEQDWPTAIKIIYEENRKMLDRDFTNPETIVKEEAQLKDKLITNDEVSQEVEARKKIRARLRETDPKKILGDSDNQQILGNWAKEIIKEDGWTGKDAKGKEVMEEAAEREAERKLGLTEAANILYVAQDCRAAAEVEVQKVFDEKKNQLLVERTKLAKAQDQNAADVTSLAPDEEQKIIEEARQTVIPQYYDEKNDIYYQLDENGRPDSSKQVEYVKSGRPVYEEVVRISKDNQSPNQAQTKELLKNLIFNKEEGKFYLPSEEVLSKRKAEEQANSPEAVMARLEEMRKEAMAFCSLPEFSEDNKILKSVLETFAQLALADKENLSNAPDYVQEVLIRQALGEYQNFRVEVVKKSIDVKVQAEIENYPGQDEKIENTKKFLEDKLTKTEGCEWDPAIGELVDKGKFSQAMLAIFSSTTVGPKHKKEILQLSPALKDSKMHEFLNQYQKNLDILNEVIFGPLTKQERTKAKMNNVLLQIPKSKWKAAGSLVLGFALLNFGQLQGILETGSKEFQEQAR